MIILAACLANRHMFNKYIFQNFKNIVFENRQFELLKKCLKNESISNKFMLCIKFKPLQ